MTAPAPDVLDRLKAAVGPSGWSDDADRLAPKLVEWRGRWRGQTPLLLLPRSTAEVAAIVRVCAETGTAVIPQGGNTGLVAGQIPRGEVLLSLERMAAVRDLDTDDDVLVVEAGATLAAVHGAAAAAGRRFPLNLASEGSATVGGLVSTNAGGTAVLRYGAMREQVLGLEAVLPSGEVMHGLHRLRKDNTGYDLRGLLIGAEGTLGVVTAAALKLRPRLPSRAVAVVGLESADAALRLLERAKTATGGGVEAFELINRLGLELALRHLPGARAPLSQPHPWVVLVELADAQPGRAEAAMAPLLAAALEAGEVADAVLAQDDTQARAFWGAARGPVRRAEAGGVRPGSTTSPSPSPPCRASCSGRARWCRRRRPARGWSPSATSATATSTTTSCVPRGRRTTPTTPCATAARRRCTTWSTPWAAPSPRSTAWAR